MNNKLEYRKASLEDVSEINNLLQEHLAFGISSEEHVINSLNRKNSMTTVVTDDGNVIAFLRTSEYDLTNNEILEQYKQEDLDFLIENKVKKVITLDASVVLPHYRTMGIAKELINKHKVEGLPTYSASWDHSIVLEKKMKSMGLIVNVVPNYYINDKLPCPYCKPYCKCQVVQVLDINNVL